MDFTRVRDSLKKTELHLHPSGEVRAAFVEMHKLMKHIVDMLEFHYATNSQHKTVDDVKPLYTPKKPELKKNGKVPKD